MSAVPKYPRFDYRSERWVKFAKDFQSYHGCRCAVCGCFDVRDQCHHVLSATLYPELAYDPENIVVLCPHCHGCLHREIFPHPTVYHYAREISHQVAEWEDVPEHLRESVHWLTVNPKAMELTQMWLETPKPWEIPKAAVVVADKLGDNPQPAAPTAFPEQLKLPEIPAANDEEYRRRG